MSRANKKRKRSGNGPNLDPTPTKIPKRQSYCKERLLNSLRFHADQDLEKQRITYGHLLKTAIPLLHHSYPAMAYLPYYNPETLHKFYSALDRTHEKPSANRIVVVPQVTGSGRTELGVAAGLDPSTNYYTILVEFFPYGFTGLLKWLKEKIKEYASNSKIRSKRTGMKILSEWSVDLFRIWMLGVIEWALDIAYEFKGDKSQARKACISAMYSDRDTRDSGVREILNDRWRLLADHNRISDYYNAYFEEIQRLIQQVIGDSGEILIYFNHVTMLKSETIGTNFGDINLYDVFSQFLRKLIQVPKWKICVADRTRHFSNVIEPESIISFTEISTVSYEAIERTLESLFNVKLADGGSDLRLVLEKLCDKYTCYLQLMNNIFQNIAKHRCYNSPYVFLRSIVLKSAKEALSHYSRDHAATLNAYRDKIIGNQGHTPITFKKLYAQIYIAIMLQNQDHIIIENDSILTELAHMDLLLYNPAKGKRIIRRKDEPMFFEAIIEYISNKGYFNVDFKDTINEEIVNHSNPIVLNLSPMKGRLTEHLLAWHWIRNRESFGNQFYPMNPVDFISRTNSNTPFVVDCAKPSLSKSSDLISLMDQQNSSTILMGHNKIDMCFMGTPSTGWNMSRTIAVVCCKPRNVNFLKAVDPDWVLSSSEKELFRYYRTDLDPAMVCEIEDANTPKLPESVAHLKCNQKYWYRIIYSSEKLPKKLIDDVNLYNQYVNVHLAPIELITLSPMWLNKELIEYLRKHEPCVVDYCP